MRWREAWRHGPLAATALDTWEGYQAKPGALPNWPRWDRLSIGFGVAWLGSTIASQLREFEPVLTTKTYKILIVTTLALIASFTPARKIPGSHELGLALVYPVLYRMPPTDGFDEKWRGLLHRASEVPGLPYELVELLVGEVGGEADYKHSIWVEPEFLEVVDTTN